MDNKTKDEELNIDNNKKRNKTANNLCFISLALTLSFGCILSSSFNLLAYGKISETLFIFLFLLGPFLNIISFMIMIVITSEYPENKFGKFLMWLHIIIFVAIIIFFIVSLISCIIRCNNGCKTIGHLG